MNELLATILGLAIGSVSSTLFLSSSWHRKLGIIKDGPTLEGLDELKSFGEGFVRACVEWLWYLKIRRVSYSAPNNAFKFLELAHYRRPRHWIAKNISKCPGLSNEWCEGENTEIFLKHCSLDDIDCLLSRLDRLTYDYDARRFNSGVVKKILSSIILCFRSCRYFGTEDQRRKAIHLAIANLHRFVFAKEVILAIHHFFPDGENISLFMTKLEEVRTPEIVYGELPGIDGANGDTETSATA